MTRRPPINHLPGYEAAEHARRQRETRGPRIGRWILGIWAASSIAAISYVGLSGDDGEQSPTTTTTPIETTLPPAREVRVMDDGTRLPGVRAELEARDLQGTGEALIQAIDHWAGTRDSEAFEEFTNLEDHLLPTMRDYFGDYGTRTLTPGEGDDEPVWGYPEWASGPLDDGKTTFLALRDGLYHTDDGRTLTYLEIEIKQTPEGLQLGAFNVTEASLVG